MTHKSINQSINEMMSEMAVSMSCRKNIDASHWFPNTDTNTLSVMHEA